MFNGMFLSHNIANFLSQTDTLTLILIHLNLFELLLERVSEFISPSQKII